MEGQNASTFSINQQSTVPCDEIPAPLKTQSQASALPGTRRCYIKRVNKHMWIKRRYVNEKIARLLEIALIIAVSHLQNLHINSNTLTNLSREVSSILQIDP